MSFDTLSALLTPYGVWPDRENVQTGLLAWVLGVHSRASHRAYQVAIAGLSSCDWDPLANRSIPRWHHQDRRRGDIDPLWPAISPGRHQNLQ